MLSRLFSSESPADVGDILLGSLQRERGCQTVPTAPKAGTRSDWRLLMAYMAFDRGASNVGAELIRQG